MQSPTPPFPQLFTDEEIESRRTPRPTAGPTMPFELVRRRYPKIAHRMLTLWGTREFDRYVARLIEDIRGGQSTFAPDMLEALTALADHHRDYAGRAGTIMQATGGPSIASLRNPSWAQRT